MFTKISANNPLFQILSQIYSYIINRINWWMDNTDTVYIVIQVWLRTKRYQRIYASNMHDFVQTIFMFEISFEQRHVPLPSFTQRNINQYQRHKIPALFRMKLTSTPSHPRSNQYILLSGNLTSFAEEFCSFRLILQISTRQSWIKFMHHFDGNMAQNRTFHHLPHFLQK